MYGKMIKLKHLPSGETVEKTVINWRNLPNDLKAQYVVLEDGEGLPAVKTPAEIAAETALTEATDVVIGEEANESNVQEPAKRGRKPKQA